MTSVFADASFYIALGSAGDQHHAAATNLALSFNSQIVTTEYVLLEVGNFLSNSRSRARFGQLVGHLQADPQTEIVQSSSSLWMRGLALYRLRSDKDWSLTDCISIALMQERGFTEALTADRHFEQAGFSILLR